VATGPTFFDAASAIRIANAVRKVEIGDRSEKPLEFDAIPPTSQRKVFRIATFSGAWSIGATKTVTFKHQTATPNTAVATNLFFPWTSSGTADCAIARDGTAWFLIDVPIVTATAVFASGVSQQTALTNVTISNAFVAQTAKATVLSGVAVAASLNTISCAITVSKTESTASITYTSGGTVASTVTRSSATLSVVTGTYTAVYVRLGVT
jgi:hypothetical protein